MRRLGILGVVRGQRPLTTHNDLDQERAPDSVKRDFTVIRLNQLRVANFYVCRYLVLLRYVAFVIDVYARCTVGWRVVTSVENGMCTRRSGACPVGTKAQARVNR